MSNIAQSVTQTQLVFVQRAEAVSDIVTYNDDTL